MVSNLVTPPVSREGGDPVPGRGDLPERGVAAVRGVRAHEAGGRDRDQRAGRPHPGVLRPAPLLSVTRSPQPPGQAAAGGQPAVWQTCSYV